ncbi:uncharacterized protein Bfra_004817 [Botrytis fragariae]|uniref:Uncharacterized protein n=1 Tax=Botrytis fragariae TaxID=1964551 RepID=A0A8H6EIC7_9HELO|nr:uncharacterized protein Bfra_004817 [Botrytis fragariae]KAF5873359.1 hypothetical protein Bfra_004817 [Botrytis fragariae]
MRSDSDEACNPYHDFIFCRLKKSGVHQQVIQERPSRKSPTKMMVIVQNIISNTVSGR